MTDVLSLTDVDVSYGKERAVHGVSLSVKEGELFGLVGANGAGKTSLIKAILGLHYASSGVIDVLGQPADQTQTRHDLVYLPEQFQPPLFLTGYEFLSLSAKFYQQDYDVSACDAMAEDLALDKGFLGKRIGSYSKGMRQKLGLMSAILSPAKLVVLDEPMSGLDPIARSRVKALLLQVKSQGRTVLMCSHVLPDLEEMCERMAILHHGHLLFSGKPETLLAEFDQTNLERAFVACVEHYYAQQVAA